MTLSAALMLTIMIETVVLFAIAEIFCYRHDCKLSRRRILLSGVVCSALTLPVLWVTMRFLGPHFYWRNIFSGEALVILAEAVILFFLLRVSFKRALYFSGVCNLFSFVIGLFL